MLANVHKGALSLEETAQGIQKLLHQVPKIERELGMLLEMIKDAPDIHLTVGVVGSEDPLGDLRIKVSVAALILAKRAELVDIMDSFHDGHREAQKATERLCNFDPNEVRPVEYGVAINETGGIQPMSRAR